MELAEYVLETLRQDGEFLLYRGQHRRYTDASPPSILALTPVSERPALGTLRRMEREYALRAELDPAWAVRPLAFTRHHERAMLVLPTRAASPSLECLADRRQCPSCCAWPSAWRRHSANSTGGA
jgi:hypothetical protein